MNNRPSLQRFMLIFSIILLGVMLPYIHTSAQNNPDIRIQLTVSKTTAKLGETLNYTITITNSGSINLTNVKLNAPRLGIFDSAVYGGFLDSGAVGVITGTFTLQDSDLPSPLNVVATVSTNQTGSPSSTVSITIDGRLATPEIDPIYIGQTVGWQPVRACDRKCVQWQLVQTNQSGDWEIARLDSLGSPSATTTNISDGVTPKSDDIAPSRSPNGEWVTFASNRDGNWEIYLASSDGTSLQRITENAQAIDMNPVWGPNNFIVYQSNRDVDWNLYLFDTVTGVETRITDSPADDVNPTWSPDGVSIAFQTNRDQFWQIYALQPQDGSLTHLSNGDRNDFEPLYSPDGRNIAFRSVLAGKTVSNVFVMGAQGGRITPVTNFEGNASHPSWSADSQVLAYQSDKDGDLEIYTYGMSTSQTRQITQNSVNDYAPAFLCEGTTLLFDSDRGGKADIYQVDVLAADATPQQLTTGSGDTLYPQDGGMTELSSGADMTTLPTLAAGRPPYPLITLSPGITEPLYPRMTAWKAANACATLCPRWSLYTGKVGNNWAIFRQDDVAAQAVNLSPVNDPTSIVTSDSIMPTLSPNGAWLVFVSNRDKYWELYVASSDGRVLPRRLTFSKQTDRNPIWSPGGQSILYESYRDSNWELYRMDISSGLEEQLTFNAADDTYARWSPDSSVIVFQSNRSQKSQIYLLNLQTKLITKISDGEGEDSQAVFAPDGKHIVFRSVRADNPNGVIWVKDVAGGGAAPISDPTQDASFPAWSNNGLLLAYQAVMNGTQAIYSYDVTSGATRQLIAGELNAYAPVWGCEGTTLLVNMGTGDAANIYVLDQLQAESPPISKVDQLVVLNNRLSSKVYAPYIAPNGQLWEQAEP